MQFVGTTIFLSFLVKSGLYGQCPVPPFIPKLPPTIKLIRPSVPPSLVNALFIPRPAKPAFVGKAYPVALQEVGSATRHMQPLGSLHKMQPYIVILCKTAKLENLERSKKKEADLHSWSKKNGVLLCGIPLSK